MSTNEAYSRVLLDRALTESGWNILNSDEVVFEQHNSRGRADYLLKDSRGRTLCVLEAKKPDTDPYDAKEQARGYAENLNAPFIILSNGKDHWFWNFERSATEDAYRIERIPSKADLERLRLKNLNPPRGLLSDPATPEYFRNVRPELVLRQYQLSAMDSIAQGFDLHHRRQFLLEMATGTGKTLLCAAIIRRFLATRNAERILFIVDRIELAKQTLEEFNAVLPEYRPVIYKTARRSGELLGSSVVIATIQSLLTNGRYKSDFTPFYFDLVINDEAHRSIYGDARAAVQFFQGTKIGLTATPKAYLNNIDSSQLAVDNPKSLEARELRDTYHYFGCAPGEPTYRYDILDAVQDPQGPFLCLPKIIDCRSDITTKALETSGWTITIDESEESFKIADLERKIFTPHRNQVMCETFLREAQRDPSGEIGKSVVFAVNQTHATSITKILNAVRPGIALTITSRVPEAASLAKEFRDGSRTERIAVSVDMLSTGYNCKDLLNVVLMRPIFSPTEYIQIKGRGTRLHKFKIGNTEYDKKRFFLLDFCAVAEYFEEKYDYSAPLPLPSSLSHSQGSSRFDYDGNQTVNDPDFNSEHKRKEIPTWEGIDRIVHQEIRIIGPHGEKVDAMTFRGSFERDVRQFATENEDFNQAILSEDDDAIEEILQERFYHRPEMFYAPDKLVLSYGVPAATPAFVYNALGKRRLPSRDDVIQETVDSLAARFNLRYLDQKWVSATIELITDDHSALDDFLEGRYQKIFERGQFRNLGGIAAISKFNERDSVFEAIRQCPIVKISKLTSQSRAQ